jgi:hypothetical protein
MALTIIKILVKAKSKCQYGFNCKKLAVKAKLTGFQYFGKLSHNQKSLIGEVSQGQDLRPILLVLLRVSGIHFIGRKYLFSKVELQSPSPNI